MQEIKDFSPVINVKFRENYTYAETLTRNARNAKETRINTTTNLYKETKNPTADLYFKD